MLGGSVNPTRELYETIKGIAVSKPELWQNFARTLSKTTKNILK